MTPGTLEDLTRFTPTTQLVALGVPLPEPAACSAQEVPEQETELKSKASPEISHPSLVCHRPSFKYTQIFNLLPGFGHTGGVSLGGARELWWLVRAREHGMPSSINLHHILITSGRL